jgi:hypothetical protein
VARLRLLTRADHTFPYLHRASPAGPAIHIPGYRLYITLYLAPPDAGELRARPNELDFARRVDAVVDTGCMLSVLPFGTWRPFESEIRWLDRPAPLTVAGRSLRVAGGVQQYRLGQVRLAATDEDGRWLPPSWSVVQCLEDGTGQPPPLLGLRSPLLSFRQLRHRRNVTEADPDEPLPEWWLEDPVW